MKRAESTRLGLLVALALLGCGDAPPADDSPSAARDGAPAQAQVAPVTDFQEYMLGDLPAPGTLSRDPFDEQGRPQAAPPAPTLRKGPTPRPAPQLRGIIRSRGRLVALFDHGSGGLGEDVRGWTVSSIDERTVTLQRNGRTVRRSL